MKGGTVFIIVQRFLYAMQSFEFTAVDYIISFPVFNLRFVPLLHCVFLSEALELKVPSIGNCFKIQDETQ